MFPTSKNDGIHTSLGVCLGWPEDAFEALTSGSLVEQFEIVVSIIFWWVDKLSNLEFNWLMDSKRASLVFVWVWINLSIKISKLDFCGGGGGG